MKRFLLIGTSILGVLVAAAIIVPFFVPKDVYKAQLEAAASSALQRDVVLAGEASVSVFPRLSASIEDVTIANAEGFEGDYMVEAGALRASVKWLGLLSGRIDVHEVALIDPTVRLQVKEDGAVNWTFGEAEPADEEGDPGNPAETGSATGGLDAGIGQARLVNAEVFYEDAAAGTKYALTGLNLEASVASLDAPLRAKGRGQFDDIAFTLDLKLDTPNKLLGGEPTLIDTALETDLGDMLFDGSFTLAEIIALEGRFEADIPDVAASLQRFDIEIAGAELVEKVEAEGQIAGTLEDLKATDLILRHRGDAFEASYEGAFAQAGEAQSVDGTFSFKTADIKRLARAIELEVAGLEALEAITASGAVSGLVTELSATGLSVSHESALLSARYEGDASLAPGGRIDGRVRASSAQLRALMAAADIVLAPGETLQSFAVEGQAAGTIEEISLAGLVLQVDDLEARGSVGANLKNERPLIKADLAVDQVDLTPFLSTAEGEGAPATPASPAEPGWSKAPLDLSSLSLVDADIALSANRLVMDNIRMSDAALTAQLRNGDLRTDLTSFNVFGGNWSGDLTLQTNRRTPALAMSFDGQSILFEEMLKAFTGRNQISGGGAFNFKATSSGASLHDIMNGLNGNLSANLADGALRGIDLSKLFRVRENLVQSLASGGLSLGLSPEDRTEFASFDNVLTIRNGVARIDTMRLLSPILKADWLGQIDLGGQTLDITMNLAADKTASGQNLSAVQLNGVAIPLRITGSWTSPSVAPDTKALGNALTSGALDQLTGNLSGNSGAGEIISGLFGSQPRASAPARQAAPAEEKTTNEEEPEEEPVRPEDLARQAARRALGSFFGD